jgi:hypothetical protein
LQAAAYKDAARYVRQRWEETPQATRKLSAYGRGRCEEAAQAREQPGTSTFRPAMGPQLGSRGMRIRGSPGASNASPRQGRASSEGRGERPSEPTRERSAQADPSGDSPAKANHEAAFSGRPSDQAKAKKRAGRSTGVDRDGGQGPNDRRCRASARSRGASGVGRCLAVGLPAGGHAGLRRESEIPRSGIRDSSVALGRDAASRAAKPS